MSLLRSLRDRSFAFLWAGQTISVFGDRLYDTALIWWVLQHTGSGEAMAWLAIVTMIPTAVFMLIGGVVVDRLPRARIMLISDLVRAVLTAMLTVLVATDRLEIDIVYGFALVFGFVDAFFQPAFHALVPQIVPSENLTSANSLSSLSWI